MTSSDPRHTGMTLNRRQMLALSGAALGTAAIGLPGGAIAQDGSVLEYGEAGSFTSFNPWAQITNQFSTANQMFSRLVYRDRAGAYTPDLAESWTISDDKLQIELKLRPGVKWHDGTDLVAQDFVTMFGYLSDEALSKDQGVGKIKSVFAPVSAIEAPDASTVVVKFSSAVPYGLDLLHYLYALRLDDPADTVFVQHKPVGTGPFKMTEFVPGQYTTFEANPDYYADGLPKVGTFRFNIYAQGASVVNNLTSGQVRGVLVTNDADLEPLQANPDYRLEMVPNSAFVLMVNVSKAPFDRVEVRQALSYSMNRKAWADVAHFGFEKPICSPLYGDASTGYVPELVDAHPFDLEKAKSLLEAAGVSGLVINFPAPAAFPNMGVYAEIWQADLAQIGVTLNIQKVDDGRWRDLGAGKDPTADVVPWTVGRCLQDSAIFFGANSLYRGVKQRFGYVNEKFEELLAQGAIEPDAEKRRGIYQELNRIVVNDCANISMMTSSSKFAWSNSVTGTTTDLAGNLAVANAAIA